MARVLHIAPHLGGGVGRFVTNVFGEDSVFDHRFLLLEKPLDMEILDGSNLDWRCFDQMAEPIQDCLRRFDIVQIEFWNHPLLYRFLAELETLEGCRIVVFSHVLGLHAPAVISRPVVDLSDRFVVASPAALAADELRNAPVGVEVIHGLGGCNRTRHVRPLSHSGFNVAYIGTASFLKLHPEFMAVCAAICERNEEVRFLFCSNDDSSELVHEAEELGIADKFIFRRQVEDIGAVLAQADVFGYPLNPRHYGTGEQAMIEAMGAGLPVVVLDNPTERHLVEDGVTGIRARDPGDYVEAIDFLQRHPGLAKKMGRQARDHALTAFDQAVTRGRFHSVYREVLAVSKKDHLFCIPRQEGLEEAALGVRLFLLSQGDEEGQVFQKALGVGDDAAFWRWKVSRMKEHLVPSKGTLVHYQQYFPEDEALIRLRSFIPDTSSSTIL